MKIDESVSSGQSLVAGEHFFPIERLGKLVSRDNLVIVVQGVNVRGRALETQTYPCICGRVRAFGRGRRPGGVDDWTTCATEDRDHHGHGIQAVILGEFYDQHARTYVARRGTEPAQTPRPPFT